MKMSEFDGTVAIVTGGASGLGAATAALLAERGARVAVLDRDIQARVSLDGVSRPLETEIEVTGTRRALRSSERVFLAPVTTSPV
jgi:NAD(P)-dependent dehydrogenase (short-subunit alcohol dehydrogenase family)